MLRALVAAALALTACSGDTADEQTGKPCDAGLLKQQNPTVSLPARLPAGVTDPIFYEKQQLGVTELFYAQASGEDVVRVRDSIADTFAQAGYEIRSRDEEPPAEAEFQFAAAKEEGSVQVTPLCAGRVTIRWRVGPR